jgi:flagellar basal-body rod protein FlgF
LRETRRTLDVAIEGPGYLQLTHAAGIAYARRGDLAIDETGRLVNHMGLPVMGQLGEIRTEKGLPVTIDAQGAVKQGEQVLDYLAIATFAPGHARTPIAGGAFLSSDMPSLQDFARNKFRTGYLEGSNVDSAAEMIGMMSTVRHYEAFARVVQISDDMMEKAVRKLGEMQS